MKKITVLACVVIVLAIVAVMSVMSRASASRPFVVVTFLSYTNDAIGTRFALFSISNKGNETIRRLDACHRESEVPSTYAYSHRVGSAASLRPGQSEVVRVIAPTHPTAWREFFEYSKDGLRRRLSDAFRWLPPGTAVKAPDVETVSSDWIGK